MHASCPRAPLVTRPLARRAAGVRGGPTLAALAPSFAALLIVVAADFRPDSAVFAADPEPDRARLGCLVAAAFFADAERCALVRVAMVPPLLESTVFWSLPAEEASTELCRGGELGFDLDRRADVERQAHGPRAVQEIAPAVAIERSRAVGQQLRRHRDAAHVDRLGVAQAVGDRHQLGRALADSGAGERDELSRRRRPLRDRLSHGLRDPRRDVLAFGGGHQLVGSKAQLGARVGGGAGRKLGVEVVALPAGLDAEKDGHGADPASLQANRPWEVPPILARGRYLCGILRAAHAGQTSTRSV